MDRLLVLRLQSSGCEAEAHYNGVPLLRTSARQPIATAPVHEYTFAGGNHVELVVEPGPPAAADAVPEPAVGDGTGWASLRLLLPRVGSAADPATARTLAQIDWAQPDGGYETPLRLAQDVELPIAFPRWRWIDAPVVPDSPTLKKEVAAYLLEIAVALARGNPEPLVQASRLRLEDLAQAYQRDLAADVARLRTHVRQLHADEPLEPTLPAAARLLLRPVASGRLLECLQPDGAPVLQSARGEGGSVAWPLRLAAIDGRFYVLR